MLFFGVDVIVVKSPVDMVNFGLLGGPRISFLSTQTSQCLNVSIPRLAALARGFVKRELPKSEQLLTVDLLARASMKNAASCDT